MNLFENNERHTRIDHSAEFRFNTYNNNGLLFENLGKFSTFYYDIQKENNSKTNHTEIRPVFSSTVSYPLIQFDKNRNKEFLKPKLQINYSPNKDLELDLNQDSIEIDIDNTNLFSINRFSGKDRQEQGLWINSGIKYENHSITGRSYGTEIGQIFRNKRSKQFSDYSGLNGKNSDLLISSFLNYDKRLSLKNTSLLTNKLDFRKSETSMSFTGKKNTLASSLIYKSLNNNNFDRENISEFSFSLLSKINKNWESIFDIRHDITNKQTIGVSAGLTFKNECVDFSFNFSKRFANSERLPEDTRFELSFDLGGFGKRDNSSKSCNSM